MKVGNLTQINGNLLQVGSNPKPNEFPLISTANNADVVIEPDGTGVIVIGGVDFEKKRSTVLLNNSAASNLFTYEAALFPAVFIDYFINRGIDGSRIGSLNIINNTVDINFIDQVADIRNPGVTFSVSIVGSDVVVSYSTTNASGNADFTYQMKKLG